MGNDKWIKKWGVPSSSNDGYYTVGQDVTGSFACSCIGWTHHMPRTDCKHIRQVRFLLDGQSSTAQTMEEIIINRMLGRAIGVLK
jgi:hypothetical protein